MLKHPKTHGIIYVILIFFTCVGFAHKVNVFATIEDGNIKLEGYFPDGKKAKNAKVTVMDNKGDTIIEGEADNDGKFIAPLIATGKVTVAMDAGLGHRSETVVEIQTGAVVSEKQAEHAHETTDKIATNPPATSLPVVTPPAGLDIGALQKQIEHSVRSAIIPLERRILEYERSTGIREIIGGLGYILGLFGIVMFFQARRQGSSRNPNDYG